MSKTYLTPNFTKEELEYSATAKAKGIDNTIPSSLLPNAKALCENVLQPIRDRIGKPITVTSGYRSTMVNNLVKGSKTSQHLTASAADITLGSREKNKELFDAIVEMILSDEIVVGQLIDEYDYTWIHVSIQYKKKNNILHLK